MSSAKAIVRLCEMVPGQEADFFALLTSKESLTTRDGQPYFKVGFRDDAREVSFPIWQNSPWATECDKSWQPGVFYKIRAIYRETTYGPQLELRRIREATDADLADGFDPAMCLPHSKYDPQRMFEELLRVVEEEIADKPLRTLLTAMLNENREQWLVSPAARHNHHAFVAGLLEHTLSVVRTCLYLADKYTEYYDQMDPPLRRDLVVAGAVLHDVGKLRELESGPEGTSYTPSGSLVGHLLQGRDMLREAAARCPIDPESLLRLEHLIIAHQRLPEWGSPKPPMTPEALIVHYADDLDAKFHMMVAVLRDDTNPGPLTSKRNVLGQQVYRGETD